MDNGKNTDKPGRKRPADTVVKRLKKRIKILERRLRSKPPTNSSNSSNGNQDIGNEANNEVSLDTAGETSLHANGVREVKTQLATYCRQDDVTAAKQCLAELQARGIAIDWCSCVSEAIYGDSAAVLQWLLMAGADPNLHMPDDNDCPLHHAIALKGSLAIIDILLAAGADPNLRNAYEESPLMVACSVRSPGIAERLIQAGADVQDPQPDMNGMLPVQYLIIANMPGMQDLELLRSLVQAGAPLQVSGEESTWGIINDNISMGKSCPGQNWGPLFNIILPLIPEPSWVRVHNSCIPFQMQGIDWWWQRQKCLLYAFGASLSVRHLQTLAEPQHRL